jgi:hypothetical protein
MTLDTTPITTGGLTPVLYHVFHIPTPVIKGRHYFFLRQDFKEK